MNKLIINCSENKNDREGYSVFLKKGGKLFYLGCLLLLKEGKNIIDIKDRYVCYICHNNREKIKGIIIKMRSINKKEITLDIKSRSCYDEAKK